MKEGKNLLLIKDGYDALDDVRKLFNEYSSSLNIDLGFQGYKDELATLPGKYAQPGGRLYLAFWEGDLAGCAAFRPFTDRVCEMKRLFVRDRFRQCKIGEALIVRLIEDAKACGYDAMLLDTLSDMKAARGLYEKHGFKETGAYYHNPVENAIYYRLVLK